MSAELSTWRKAAGTPKGSPTCYERTPLIVVGGRTPAYTVAQRAINASLGGSPIVILHDHIDPTRIAWPKVRFAYLCDTWSLTDAEIVEVATAMLDAGIEEVHADVDHHFGRPATSGASPWIFRAEGLK